ncbi:MAG TPA: peptide ABC transporter substrate-binding protein [Clostridia bacterium]|nr:peptide ABC transporter substrate-binding protein [Clostridia bacterium]
MRKVLSLLLVTALLFGAMAGVRTATAATVEIRWNNGAEPQTIDPALSTGIPEANTILQVFEGLTRLDKNNNPIPAVAKSWTISTDKKTYMFTLRDSFWTNGTPVTAYDFEYAWKRALQPETAAEYAYQLYYVYGGEAYNKSINVGGKYYKQAVDAKGNPVTKKEGDKDVPVADMKKEIDPSKNVGVRALNAKTLKVYLASPTAYFLSLCAFPTLMPVCKAVVSKNASWTKDDLKAYITNGPFKAISWSHSEKMVFIKNPTYWDKANVKPDKLTYYMIDDESTALAQYQSGALDASDIVPLSELPALVKSGDCKIMPYLGTYYYSFNVTKKPFNDVRVRKALTLAINRSAITLNITRAGEIPALGYVPYGIPDATATAEFRTSGTEKFYKDNDVATAKALLAAAGYPNGKGFPAFTILYNNSSRHKSIAEAIQQMWKTNLGINCTLKNEEWGVYLDDLTNLNYTTARRGWIGDYVDVNTFMDMWVTGGGNNDTGWSSKQYDADIAKAKVTTDPKARMKLMHDAENILMREFPIAPVYYYTHPILLKSGVKGLVLSTLGFVDWKNATISG